VKHSSVSQQIVSQSAKHELDRNEPKYLYFNHIYTVVYSMAYRRGQKENCLTFSHFSRLVQTIFCTNWRGGGVVVRTKKIRDVLYIFYYKFYILILYFNFHPILRVFLLFIFIISQYCPTVKRILPNWPSLPNNMEG
jgi:hypothetical protein